MSSAGNVTKTAVTPWFYLHNHNNFRMGRVISTAQEEDKEVSLKDAKKAYLSGEYQSITAAAGSVRKQHGHTFSHDHLLVASEEAANPMRTYRRQYDVCVGRVSEARRAPLEW